MSDLEKIVTFQADIPKFSFDAKGNLVITVLVAAADKWDALPLTDIRGRRFTFDVKAAPARARRVRAAMAMAPRPNGDTPLLWEDVKASWTDGD